MSPLTLSRGYEATHLAERPVHAATPALAAAPVTKIDILPATQPGLGNWRARARAWWRRNRLLAGALLAALVLAAPICVMYRQPIWHQIQLSTVRQSVAYDELYFTDSTALPVQVTSKVTREVVFGVQRDGPATTVRYNVLLTDSRGTSRVRTGSVRLSPAAASVVVERFRVPVKGPFEFKVQLLPSGPDILFHGRAS